MKLAVSSCIPFDILCIFFPSGINIKTECGIAVSINNVIFQSSTNNTIMEPTMEMIPVTKLERCSEIYPFTTVVSFVIRLTVSPDG